MANRVPDLAAVAESLADHTPVDWEAIESGTSTPEDRQRLHGLRAVGRIIDAYRQAGAPDPSQPTDNQSERLPPGARWGSLTIVEHLGSGTFGDVYRARDQRLDRDVALKLLHGPSEAADDLQSAVVHEGRLLARVRHPNVATVYGADSVDGRVGVWMELVEGRSLEDEVRERGDFPADEVAAIGGDLCRALTAVHDAGVLHRDVKAQNVMRDARNGRVVLMDFSAGRESAEPGDGYARLPGTLAGSPIYLAPEILEGQRANPRSDVYSLGVLLFRLVSGRFPVSGSSIAEIRDAHASSRRATLGEVCPGLAASVSAPIERAISADPRERFASAREMELALSVPPRRQRWPWAVAAGLAVALVAGLASVFAGRPRTPPLPFAERDWVLIAPFENRTGEAVLDDLLQPALERELTASGYVNVVPRARVEDTLALMRKPLDTRLDARLAREVSLRDGGIRAVVAGQVMRAGSQLMISADIVDPSSGNAVASVSTSVQDQSDVPSAVRDLALDLRRRFGESRSLLERGGSLAAVTTPSIEALQLYSKAAALLAGEEWRFSVHGQRRFETARELLRRATALDPDFASAWVLLSHALCAFPDARCLPEAERAAGLTATVTPVERHFIDGFVARRRAYQRGAARQERLREAARAYEALLQFVPDHYWTLMELIPVYRELGQHDDADRIAERAAAIRPHSIRFAVDLARVHLRRRDSPALEGLAEAILTRIPADVEANEGDQFLDIAWIRTWRAHDAWLRGDVAAALAAVREAEARWQADTRQQWLFVLITQYRGLGRFSDALRVSERLPPEMRSFNRTRMPRIVRTGRPLSGR